MSNGRVTDAENKLIAKHGVEGLAKIRAEASAAKAAAEEAKLAAERQAALDAENDRKRRQRIAKMADFMVEIGRRNEGEDVDASWCEPLLSRPAAKKLLGLTETNLKRLVSQGALGRSKSSFLMTDLLPQFPRLSNCSSKTSLFMLKAQLHVASNAHPELVELATTDARCIVEAQILKHKEEISQLEVQKSAAECRLAAASTLLDRLPTVGEVEPPAAKRAKTAIDHHPIGDE